MALADIRRQVTVTLAQTHEAQREARADLAYGGDDAKVLAAGELEHLARWEAMLKRRLVEIDRRMAQRSNPFAWARQAWFGLMLYFESWIAHG